MKQKDIKQLTPFAKRLLELRKEKSLTQHQLAELVGIPQGTYKEYELGTEANYTNLIKLSKFHGYSVGYLIGSEDY
ncbi:MAG: helix-turn-helix domain-containing protein [Firmicutes bacterium]|nr:helix-turn-helix domain-containing protein [Bacillota bacterium]